MTKRVKRRSVPKLKSDFRYTPVFAFDTFPWPQTATVKQIDAAAAAARELRRVRAEKGSLLTFDTSSGRVVEPLDSKSDDLLQVTDLLTGCVNNRLGHPAGERKQQLRRKAEELGLISDRNIWVVEAKNRRAVKPTNLGGTMRMETTDGHRWTQILQSRSKLPRLRRRSPFGETLGDGLDGLPICVHLRPSVVSLLFNYIVPA